jgi:hypothetical protein
MTIELSDRNTQDMFVAIRGRPRTSPHTREEQHRINKREQRERDKTAGLKRVELKLTSHLVEQLDQIAKIKKSHRGAIIEALIEQEMSLLAL